MLSRTSSTPRSRIRWISASRTSRGRRYAGIPNRIIPPGLGPASRIVTACPRQRQVVRRGEAGRAGSDHQHPLAGRGGVDVDGPALLDRLVAQEALDRVDADRLVEHAAVAGGLARVVADPAHHRGERVGRHDRAPGPLVAVAALLGVVQPRLDVLARGAGVVAGRLPLDVHRPLGAPGSRLVGAARADVEGDRERLVHLGSYPWAGASSRPKRAMLRSARACSRAITSVATGSPNRWA